MKKIVHRDVRYMCSICKSEYKSKKQAQECETRILEIKPFKVGDTVTNIEPRVCGQRRNRPYRFQGTITAIHGPFASDYENEVKWLGAIPDRVNGHVFEFTVNFTCPICQTKKLARYYSPELKKI